MITDYNNFIKENLSNFDLSKIVSIIAINKDKDGNWIYTTQGNKELFLPKDSAGKISLVDDKLANFVNSGNPINKYFELDNNTIIYAANFACDAVPMRDGHVYLIERKDNRGWALPGGFIDPGETPEFAVKRELHEETMPQMSFVNSMKEIKSIEPLGIIRANDDPREVNVFTYPFIIQMKNSAELKFGDDAKKGKWVLLSRAINSQLAFSHHNEILKKVNY